MAIIDRPASGTLRIAIRCERSFRADAAQQLKMAVAESRPGSRRQTVLRQLLAGVATAPYSVDGEGL